MIYPVLRAFSSLEIRYNEGWNVYMAVAADHHVPFYSQKFASTTSSYPALSFYVVAWLHRIGLGYLIAGRALSLASFLVSCLLVGLIVWKFSQDFRAALFSSFFCSAVFCIAANEYIGSDDPQMFAQVLFLCGFLVYISGPPRFSRLALTTLLFVLGGSVKHNLIEFPIAVLIDLAFVGRKRLLQYLSLSAVLLGVSIYVHTLVGGPFFVSSMLSPRSYSLQKAFFQFMEYGFGPVSLAMIAALLWTKASLQDQDHRLRILAILFLACLLVGCLSGGVIGLWVNCYFDLYLSVAMIVGLLMHRIWGGEIGSRHPWTAVGASVALLLSFVPVWATGPSLFQRAISALPEKQNQFESEVAFLRAHPGPAFCESLLRCYEAGKPYEYDPFGSASLIRLGKSDDLLNRLNRGEIAVVQLCCSIDFLKGDDDPDITSQMLSALETSYELGLSHEGCYIYVPKNARPSVSEVPKMDRPSPTGEHAAQVSHHQA